MLLFLLACTGSPEVCVPGETQGCLCAGARDGAQVCGAAGDRWSECACDDDSSPGDADDTGIPEDPDGASLFADNCASCHGAAGHGTRNGPDLRDEVPEMSDGEIREVITEGEDDMPAFSFAAAELDALVAWLRDVFGAGGGADADDDEEDD